MKDEPLTKGRERREAKTGYKLAIYTLVLTFVFNTCLIWFVLFFAYKLFVKLGWNWLLIP